MTVEEIIAKIKVEGNADYDRAMSKMSASSKQFGNIAQAMGAKVTGAFSAIARSLISPAGLLGTGAIGAGLVGIGAAAFHAAADFEQLNQTLIVLTGSADKAKKKLDFVKALAIPATFTFSQLAQAGTQLEAFGLRLERGLPIIAKLGAAFGVKDKEQIDELTRALGVIASGRLPEADVRSRFGLTEDMFKHQGIRFDKGGQLLSSAQDTFKALERIVDSKYPNILERMAGTTNSKLSSMRDKWEELLRQIGNLLIKFLVTPIDKVTAALGRMTSGSQIEKFAKVLTATFKELEAIAAVVAGVLAAVVAFKIILGFVSLAKAVLLFAAGLIQAVAAAGALATIIGGFKAALPAIIAIAVALGVGFFAFRQAQRGFANLDKLIADFMKPGPNEGPGKVPSDQGGIFEPGQEPLQQIAGNTRRIADYTKPILDLKKIALGGGDLGRIGVTPVEFAGMRNRHGGPITINIMGGNTEQLQNAILSMRRRGLI